MQYWVVDDYTLHGGIQRVPVNGILSVLKNLFSWGEKPPRTFEVSGVFT